MRLPDPPVPVLSHGLSPKDCELIANIILTWGAAEDEIGNALLFVHGIYEEEIAEDFVIALDARRKRDLLRKALKRRDPAHAAIPLITRIARAYEDWADDRNILAHGFGARSEGGTIIVSSLPKPPFAVRNLTEALNRANWLYLAYSEVRRIVVGTPSDDPLPDRPA